MYLLNPMKQRVLLKKYSFDIFKAEEIFDHLLEGKILKLPDSTNSCSIFRDRILDLIKRGKLKFPERKMGIDEDPFPAVQEVSINMHDMPIEVLIRERERAKEEDHAKRLEAMAKRSLSMQAPDENFAKNLCVGCGKNYVEICKKRSEIAKDKQVLSDHGSHEIDYPYGFPSQPIMSVGRGQFRGLVYQTSMVPRPMVTRYPPRFTSNARGSYQRTFYIGPHF